MKRIHAALMAVASVAGLAAAGTGTGTRSPAERPVAAVPADRYMSAPDLAKRIISGETELRVFDLRSMSEFEAMHVPTAQHASIENLLRARLPENATIVVYSEGDTDAEQAWSALSRRGNRHIFILREGLYQWIARVIEPRLALDASPSERSAFEEAAAQSRFFGGVPRADVTRAEVPGGYWTGTGHGSVGASRQAVAAIRRRGC